MNYFIDTFLDILTETLIEMNAELKEKQELLRIASDKITNDDILNGKDQKYKDMMFVLAQNHFFDSSDGITVNELSDRFNLSSATIRKILKGLFELNFIEKIGERPAYYRVKQQYFEDN